MLKKILQEYIDNANKPMSFGNVPITPSSKRDSTPIIGMSKWSIKDEFLVKTYMFAKIEQRNDFVFSILSYERETQHHSIMTIDENSVTIRLLTKDVKKITELDKEYAKYSDLLFKEVLYNSINESKLSSD